MFVLLFCFSLVSIRESKYKGKSGLLKDVCIWLSLFRMPCLLALYPRNAVLNVRKCLFHGLATFCFFFSVVSA